MKLAFCVDPEDSNLPLQDRFGRSRGFALVDSESGKVLNILQNPFIEEAGGAGTASLQMLIDAGAEGIIAPEVGPKAMDAVQTLGIPVWKQQEKGILFEALEDWKQGVLPRINKAGSKGLHLA